MNRFDTTGITDPSKQLPLLGPSVAFMQDANKDLFNAFALSLIGDLYNGSDAYALYGCTNNGAGQYFTGYIYWNQEVFKFAGRNISLFTNPGVFQIQDAATAPMDPYNYTDGTVANVHRTRTIDIVDLPNGTAGTFNISALKFSHNPPTGITVSSFSNSFTSSLAVVYRKNNNGLVTIQGKVAKTTAGSIGGQTIFTLPAGYRPVANARLQKAMVIYDSVTCVIDVITIFPTTGVISMSGYNAPGSFAALEVFFDNSFYAD